MNWLLLGSSLVFGAISSYVVIRIILAQEKRPAAPARAGDFHHGPAGSIPRIGGIALMAGLLLGPLLAWVCFGGGQHYSREGWVILGTAMAMFAVGLWDDLRALGARRKLLLQILVAAAACYGGLCVQEFKIPLTERIIDLGGIGGFIFTVFWLVALTNLINLIDGVDGLAGGIALMTMVLLVYVCGATSGVQVLCAGMAGALITFLRYNFPPARLYMGDGGAYLLGFLIGTVAIVSSHKGTVLAALIAPLFVLALPILDTSLAILRRGLRGLPVFRPDRRHIHHRMLQLGWSRRRTVLTLYCFCLLFLAFGFGTFASRGQLAPLFAGLGALVLLMAARKLSFSREWFAVGRVVGNSLQMRAEIQYALVQTQWLVMEGRRSRSVEELWEDLVFVSRKLGFVSIRLRLCDGERFADDSGDCPNLISFHTQLAGGRLGEIELKACVAEMRPAYSATPEPCHCLVAHPRRIADRQTAEVLGEVLAEGWSKTARTWLRYHGPAGSEIRFAMNRLLVPATGNN